MTRILSVLFLGLMACGDKDETDLAGNDTEPAQMFAVTLTGTEYTPHSDGGHAVRATLFDGSGAEIDTQEVAVVDGTFTVTWADALEAGSTYELLWYADMNGDDACQNPPDDHVWRNAIAAVGQDVVINHTHSAADFATCN